MLLFHEWPLVLFTLLSQMAVGIVFVGEFLLVSMARKNSGQSVSTSIRRQSCAGLVFLAVAALLSLSHTGTPLHSLNTVLNVGSSWLSREILMMGAFGLSLFWLCLMRVKRDLHPKERLVAVVSIVLGCVLIATTAQVYRLPTVPGWNNGAVFFHFFGSAFMLGAFWHGLMAGFSHPYLIASPCVENQPKVMFSTLLMYACAGFALIAVSLPLSVPAGMAGGLGGPGGQEVMNGMGGMLNTNSVLIPLSCLIWSLALHALLLALALLLFMGCLLRVGFLGACAPAWGMIVAFLLFFAAEFFGRTLFYLAYARLGM